jgi:hypothetical protein
MHRLKSLKENPDAFKMAMSFLQPMAIKTGVIKMQQWNENPERYENIIYGV